MRLKSPLSVLGNIGTDSMIKTGVAGRDPEMAVMLALILESDGLARANDKRCHHP